MNAHDDERTLHRLEAFSDIVMGFCLAEIGLGLILPNTVVGLAAMWPSLTAFAFSFVLIATLWWNHHRLFVTYVVLNPATVVMNFVLLGALALAIYFQQVVVHFLAIGLSPAEPGQLYLACMTIVFGLLTAMYASGIWIRRKQLAHDDLGWGVDRTCRQFIGTVLLCCLTIVFPAAGHDNKTSLVLLALLVAIMALRRLVVPRITATIEAMR